MIRSTHSKPSDALQIPCRSPQQDGRRCCYCGGEDFQLLHSWEPEHPRNTSTIPLGIWQCRCKLAYLHPVPAVEQLPDEGDWWSPSRSRLSRNRRFKHFRAGIQNLLFGSPRWRLIQQTRKAQPGGRFLDIGCGTGTLLELARPYYDCVGLEPSERAAQQARAQGFPVIQSTLEEGALEPASFDVALMDAVLEHLLDPVEALGHVNRCLKMGGVVAVKVPKLWGPSHRRHGREWNGYRVGYHTVLFTGETLSQVMRAAGFEPLKSPRRDRPLDDILILWGRKVQQPNK